ncbi:MAG: alpha-amylase [Candidatus Sericytochromatia bacterium]|nr:MAG: alpha-amylase [Candidatus Sericytochromatia bacterium]
MKKFLFSLIISSLSIGCAANDLEVNNLIDNEQQISLLSKKTINNKWQNQIIYFIFTDRFSNGNKSNDFNVNSKDPWAYHGGDLQGVINKLDYIKDLGATAIWITPPMDNRDTAFKANFGGGKYQDIWAYHGYWTKNFYAVDEHLGNIQKMKELVKKAHSKGIKVIIDIVMNHLDYDHEFAKDRKNPNSKYHTWFNHYGKIEDSDWNNPWKVEHGELAELPDLNQNNPEVKKYLLDATKWWITQTGCDGLRLDTVKHVGHNFWKEFSKEIHNFAGEDFLLLGEVYDPNTEVMVSYINDGIDSVFDFPLYYVIKNTLGQNGNMRDLARFFEKDRLYPNPNMVSPFIDNHDVPRFVTEAGNNSISKLKLAMALIMTIRGIPTIYYGTEIALQGGSDPDNRRDMIWDNRNQDLRNYLKKLISIRKSNPVLYTGKQLEMWQDENVFGFLRTNDDPNSEIIVVMNNSDNKQIRSIQIRAESKMQDGTILNNLLDKDSITVNNRRINVELKPKEVKIFKVNTIKNR